MPARNPPGADAHAGAFASTRASSPPGVRAAPAGRWQTRRRATYLGPREQPRCLPSGREAMSPATSRTRLGLASANTPRHRDLWQPFATGHRSRLDGMGAQAPDERADRSGSAPSSSKARPIGPNSPCRRTLRDRHPTQPSRRAARVSPGSAGSGRASPARARTRSRNRAPILDEFLVESTKGPWFTQMTRDGCGSVMGDGADLQPSSLPSEHPISPLRRPMPMRRAMTARISVVAPGWAVIASR